MEGVNGKVIKKAGGAKPDGKEGRPVAVDWALSKEKWEENQKAEGKGKDTGGGDEAVSDSEEEESEEESDGDDTNEEKGEGGDVEMEEEPVKPQLPTVDVGSTLFIRNLPFEVTEQELGAL